jgi:hypothetical protein
MSEFVHCTICASVVTAQAKRACGCAPQAAYPAHKKGKPNVTLTRNDPDPDDCDDFYNIVTGRQPDPR